MLIFDIESDGLLDTITKIHSLVIKDTKTNQVLSCHHNTIPQGIELLDKTPDTIVGHNILAFDIPAIHMLTGVDLSRKPKIDTLTTARLRHPEMISIDSINRRMGKLTPIGEEFGKHSLDAWGQRLGLLKGDFGKTTDWKEWSPEMQAYCERDVEVTHALLNYLKIENLSKEALELEHRFAEYIALQERTGCPFDVQAAQNLLREVLLDHDKIKLEVCTSIPPWKTVTTFTPKRDNQTKGFKKGVPIERVTYDKFNPNSRQQVARLLQDKYNWQPIDFTDKGNPEVSGEVLRELPYPEAKRLADLFDVSKLLGQLSDGENAWLKLQRNGRIHGAVNSCGAITGRCTHFSPNLGQVPSKGSYRWAECRSLFYSPSPDYDFVGGDAKALELRMLGHYLAPYDGGEYADVVVNGDVHTLNQEAIGLELRDTAKTFIYAFLYGAGDEKLGRIISPTASPPLAKALGRRAREQFSRKIPAMGKLIEDIKYTFQSRGFLKGLDGRTLVPRGAHSAPNTLLQSGGAVLMKKATVIFREKTKGLDVSPVLHIHDEWQSIAHNSISEDVAKMIPQSIKEAGEYFKLACPMDGSYAIGRNWKQTH